VAWLVGQGKVRKKEKKEKRKTTQAAKSSSPQLRKRGHLGRKAPSPEKLSYDGFRPSARWVDCWACWTLPAQQKNIYSLRDKKE